jgi:enoyl-CoA hydratase
MAIDQSILTDVQGHVATIAINRPDKLNALNEAVRQEVSDVLRAFEADDGTHVVIITGTGKKAFVAGADIGEFEGRSSIDQFKVMTGVNLFQAVEDFNKPVIAAINGFCLGGGCELAMACDIRIASENAKLGQPEINLGIMPGGGGTQRLPRLVGLGQAYKLLYTGELISAAEAHRIGLVDEVTPPETLLDRAMALAQAIAQKSPVALRLIKEAVRASVRTPLDAGLRTEAILFGLAFSSEDKAEGVNAFLEKRPATFTGR